MVPELLRSVSEKTKQSTGVGINWINHERSMSILLGRHCNVAQAELLAINECIQKSI